MDMIAVTLNLPADIAQQAQAAGLLEDGNAIQLFVRELERLEKVKTFFEDIERLSEIEPEITPEELEAEIAAYRAGQ